jgi:hypothetical protein
MAAEPTADIPAAPEYPLPAPALDEHYYLYAIVVELRKLRAAFERSVQAQAEHDAATIELREPKPKPRRGE